MRNLNINSAIMKGMGLYRGRRSAPMDMINHHRYDKMRAENFVRTYALPSSKSHSEEKNKSAQNSNTSGPICSAVVTSEATKHAPRSGAPVSVGDWYGKQRAGSRATRNGEPVGWREDAGPAKRAPARRPVYGAMVLPSAWSRKLD